MFSDRLNLSYLWKLNMKMCLLSSSVDLDILEPRKILHWHLVYLYKYLWLDKNILCFRSNRDQCLTIASNNFPTQNCCQVLWITKAYSLWSRRVGRVIKVHLFLFITCACRAKASWHFFPVMLLILSSVYPQISTL